MKADQGKSGDSTGVSEPDRPAFDAIDLETPIQTSEETSEQGSGLELVENDISSGQPGSDGAARLDASWFTVARSGVDCVLCAVRGFQQRCMRSVTGGGAATGRQAKEAQCANTMAACRQCGLQSDWHELNMSVRGITDGRLRDDELVCAARVVALWEQMKSAGASLGKLDAKQMAAACMWLETGARGGRELPGKMERGIINMANPRMTRLTGVG